MYVQRELKKYETGAVFAKFTLKDNEDTRKIWNDNRLMLCNTLASFTN